MQAPHTAGARSAVEPAELIHTERVLAIGRATLAFVSTLNLLLTGPGGYPPIVGDLLQGLGVVSAALLLVAWKAPLQLRGSAVLLHVMDLLWAVVITTVTEGPASVFFAFFFYVLVAAAYRWGLNAALATAVVANVLVVVQTWALAAGVSPHAPPAGWNWTSVVISAPLLIWLALFIGHLAREQRRLRDEAALTSALVASARLESGVRSSLASAAHHLLAAYGATRLWAVLRDAANATTVLCDARLRDGEVALTLLAVAPSEATAWEFVPPRPCEAFVAWRRGTAADHPHSWTLWPSEIRIRGGRAAAVLDDMPWDAAIGATAAHGEWQGQFIVLDPARPHRRIARAAFLCRALRQAMPAFLGVNLMQRLRTRVGAIERARVARELHDGVIQSLSGLQLQVEAARRQIASAPEAAEASLDRVQAVLRQEVLDVRDLMHQMRHTDVDPGRVIEHMTEVVERFRRDTGIAAKFASGLADPELPRDVAREMVRMLQEALVNIRKHSGAQSVVVRFGVSGDAWCLVVDDDGRGFEFSGRFTLEELDQARRGPVVLKERVRAVGGYLWLTSEPGQGSRLEIHVPRGTHGR